MEYNGFNIPDNAIDNLVDNLEISIADACELWLADNGKITNEEQEKANKQAEKAPRRYEQGVNPRKKVEKERKVDINKGYLLEIIKNALVNDGNCTNFVQNNEVTLDFTAFNDEFTIKLTKHRKKK